MIEQASRLAPEESAEVRDFLRSCEREAFVPVYLAGGGRPYVPREPVLAVPIVRKPPGKARLDRTGQRVGCYVVLRRDEDVKGRWWCRCDCGQLVSRSGDGIRVCQAEKRSPKCPHRVRST